MLLSWRIIGASLTAALGLTSVAYGQGNPATSEPPSRVPLHLGPVALAPAITVNVGWDSNVFNQEGQSGDTPGDVTGSVRPELNGWLRLGRARVSGRGAWDFVYFRDYSSERSVDSDYGGGIAVPLARLTPYISGWRVSARQRFGFEIDERTRRHEEQGIAGVEVRLGPRTSIDVSGRRGRMTFDRGANLNPFVSEFYDFTSHGATVFFRQRVTPLTTVGVTVDSNRDRFDNRPARDSDSLRIAAGLEFKPFALITGSIYGGWRQVRLVAPGGTSFTALVTAVDLAYTLLGRTRFSLQARRDPTYSAVQGQHAYLLSGGTASITHRFGGGWDARGLIGRYRLAYGLFVLDQPDGPPPVGFASVRETVTDYGGEIGYRIRSAVRLALEVRRQNRNSTVNLRGYERTLAGVSFSYRP